MTFLAKLIFVSASWCPVYLLIGVLLWSTQRELAVTLFIVGAISLIGLWFLEVIVRRLFAKEHYKITECEPQKSDIFMYILSYIPPFFAIDVSSSEKLSALLLLYIFIFVTYVRLDQYHLNPLFVFFGYQVYKVRTEGRRQLYVIVRGEQPIRCGDQVRLVTLAGLALAV